MKAQEKRQKIFKKFATNLKEYLDYHGLWAVTKLQNGYKKIEKDIYICPLCKSFFYQEAVFHYNNCQPLLTLEHNPPANIGGSASILTCSSCNNSNGSKIDKVINTYIRTEDFIKGKDGAKIKTRSKIGDYYFGGELELNSKKHNTLFFDKASNEYGFSNLLEKFKTGEIRTINFEFKLADQNVLNLSLLKIAHLTAFKYLGYSYLLNHSGYKVIQILNGLLKHPNKNCGVMGFDFSDENIGLSVIKKPQELRSLLVVQKVEVLNKRKNVGVIIPAPDEEGLNSLANFDKYINSEVHFNFIKYSFKNFPSIAETYYNMFR